MNIPNFQLHAISVDQFKAVLKDRLGLIHPMTRTNETWARKLPDFKMISAHLFPQFLTPTHEYWGYADMDLVWGNISRWAHWFQGQHPVIKTHYYPHGPAQFFLNDPIYTKELYADDAAYVNLLAKTTHFNLDECGLYTSDKSNAEMAMEMRLNWHLEDRNLSWNGGTNVHATNVMMDSYFCGKGKHGPVLWQDGSLKVLAGNEIYPAGREILYFHRPYRSLNIPNGIRKRYVIDDMLYYGYLLPNWIPLMTRSVCRETAQSSLHSFHPFHSDCFGKDSEHVLKII